jgi:hypothetical protein
MVKLDAVRAALKPRTPYCCGTLPITPERCVLFYTTGPNDRAGYGSHSQLTRGKLTLSTEKSTCCLQRPKSSTILRAHVVPRLEQKIKTFAPCQHSSTPLRSPLHSTQSITVSLKSFGVNFLKVAMTNDHYSFLPITSRSTVSDCVSWK